MEKFRRQSFKNRLPRCNRDFISSLLSFGLVLSSSICVNRFKFSAIHSSNHRPRASRQLKKPAQLARAFMQNEFFTSKPLRSNAKTTTSTVLFSLQNIKSQNTNSIVNSWWDGGLNKSVAGCSRQKPHDGFDKNTRSRVYTDAIQFQAKKAIEKPRSIRLIKNQSEYIVWTTFQQRRCWFCKNWPRKKQSLGYLTIEPTGHLRASRIVDCQ